MNRVIPMATDDNRRHLHISLALLSFFSLNTFCDRRLSNEQISYLRPLFASIKMQNSEE